MQDDITVSINMLSYNHEKYIAQAIEGVLMQRTNFKFELLIHDDASTDNSQAIIRSYEERYPEIIKPVYQIENQHSKRNGAIARIQRNRSRGKYIAMCEGDDYWTDENKLQKQVDFLETHPDYSAVYSNVRCVDENGKYDEKIQIYPLEKSHIVTFKSFIGNWSERAVIGQTATLVHRNHWMGNKKLAEIYDNCRANGDEKLSALLSYLGDVYYMEDCMADHRRVFTGDSWTAATHNKNMYKNHYERRKNLIRFINEMSGQKIDSKKILKEIVVSAVVYAMKTRNEEDVKIAKDLFKDYNCPLAVITGVIAKFSKKIFGLNKRR